MNLRTLVARSLRFHWRSHLGVVLGAAVAATVLVGALAVGDSVRYSLARMARARLGDTHLALVGGERFFRSALADDLERELGAPACPSRDPGAVPGIAARVAAVIQVGGIAARPDAAARAGQTQVLGVEKTFWTLGGAEPLLPDAGRDAVAVNRRTARHLGLAAGERIVLRLADPGAVPADVPLSGERGTPIALRPTVQAVADDDAFGRFSLAANQVPPFNVFVPLGRLQAVLGFEGKANVLLIGPGGATEGEGPTVAAAEAALRRVWQLADAGLDLQPLTADRGAVELATKRVLLDPPVGRAAARRDDTLGVLTYLVNELRAGDRATPYSMVTAMGPLAADLPDDARRRMADHLPAGLADLADDEILINTWLADDLAAAPGDRLTLTYYVPGPTGRLTTASAAFRVRAVVPIEGPAADRTLMPAFPGVSDADDCRQWEPGVDIDYDRIRPKDEAYWDDHRGTPKAFVTLAAGRRMWANRFGDLTAVRFVGGADAAYEDAVRQWLRGALDPAAVGLVFHPVQAQARAASGQAMDFGQLFLGLSMFLIVAALVLTGLLFALGAEQRTEETGTLLALGFPPRRVRRLMLAEGACLVAVGTAVGAAGGLAFTRLVLVGLATVWQSAVGASDIRFHVRPATLAIGAGAAVAVALVTVWLTLRRQARAPARELLASGAEADLRPSAAPARRPWVAWAVAGVCAVAAAGLVAGAGFAGGGAHVGAFFGAGALLLTAGLAACWATLGHLARASRGAGLSAGGLGLRNATRRRGRSLATVALVAFGAFLVVAVGANRRTGVADPGRRDSGTGGFRLMGETTIPVHHDLLSPEGLKHFGLPADLPKQITSLVAMRVHDGDDASCLNLNRVQKPRLAGVAPSALAERGSFTFAETAVDPGGADPWTLLDADLGADVVPAIGDAASIQWSLGKRVGDEVAYTDGRGRPFRLRIVGAVANSVLQGALYISDEAFRRRFPAETGYRMFLIDVPAAQADEVSRVLSQQLADVGLEVTPAAERLAELGAMQNTYLAIFQTLGVLALVLGSAGLGIVVLRNVLERRGELALMRAVGWRRRALYRLVLMEHWGLLAMGLGCGIASAAVAVAPVLAAAGSPVPVVALAGTLLAVGASGMLWTYLATRFALRGPLLAALRNE